MEFFSNISLDLIVEALGFCVGLLYLWWEYNADKRMWYASVVMPCFSLWIYFNKGLYADFAINIYYLAIAVYGFFSWTRASRSGKSESAELSGKKAEKKQELPVSNITPGQLAGCSGVFLTLWAALFLGLRYLTDSNVPLADAFTTALSIVGMWMLARKILQQWIVWIVVDAVCVGLYAYKEIYFYAVLYAVYTVIAFLGYRKWKKLLICGC